MTETDLPEARIRQRLMDRIASEGVIPVSAFMAEALFDPVAGFYATKDPIGAGSDFITAPEISQMFGEVIGLWLAQAWIDMGSPARVQLIELGPGKGTLMHDILRTARVVPGFVNAMEVTLVEASPALKMVQGETLAESPVQIRWADRIERAPAGPSLVVGNEFLDCLPIRQAVRTQGLWRERCVGLHPEDESRLAFVPGPQLADADLELIAPALRDGPDGTLAELRPGDHQMVEALAARFTNHPGRALFIDYGPDTSEAGDTLQAIRAHEKVDPLDRPGTADLTARVDFQVLSQAARSAGLSVHGPTPQRDYLAALGIAQRTNMLAAKVPEKRETLLRQLDRLTAEDEMGTLFKAICLSSEGLPPPAGLGPSTA